MEYVYDIVLNFHDKYYDFYEWKSDDKIINIKKIPIYKIDSQDYLNIKYNDILIDKSSLPKDNKMFLVTNGSEVMGLVLSNKGNNKKSSLLFEEADDLLEDKELIKKINIKYVVNKKNEIRFISRQMEEKNNYINKYLANIDKCKDEYLLKYLYYDIFNIDEDSIDKVYNDLNDLAKNDIFRIYDAIKRVNMELKR